MSTDTEDFLSHYGVKGMKWGKRNKRTQKESREISKRKKIASKRRTLSDKEIETYIGRLEKEKKLKSLIEDDLSPGKKVAKQIMSDTGQKVVKTVATGAALYAIKVGIGNKFKASDMKKLDWKEAAQYLAPKPKNK